MKRYITASITSEVNDIVHNLKDVKVHENITCPHLSEEDVIYEVRSANPEDLEIVKYEFGDPDYMQYHKGLSMNYQGPYYIGKWKVYTKYNATKNEELNALLKRIKTFDELQEFFDAVSSIGDGTWFYTKRGLNPLNGGFEQDILDPEYVTYIVDGHFGVLRSKISNLYRVLKLG